MAVHRTYTILAVALIPLFVRLLLLPVIPPPQPAIHDEFSYLLAADTFASGRLTNPPHPLWRFFESEQIFQQPTYMSKYPPLTGLILAAGQRLFGHPWAGALISMAIFGGVLCWALQGWLPPPWALLGSLVGILKVAFLNYWTESYWGGFGAAIGGALLIGSLPRIVRRPSLLTGLPAATGVGLLSISRPFEGIILTILCGGYLVFSIIGRSGGLAGALRPLARAIVVPCLIVMLPVGGWILYYNYRITGHPLTMPYSVHEKEYASAALFSWQEEKKIPEYRHESMRRFWVGWELRNKTFQRKNFLLAHLVAYLTCARFYWGAILLVAVLAFSRKLASSRRLRAAFWLGAIFLILVGLEVNFQAHYLAPATALAYVAAGGALRAVRYHRTGGVPWGAAAIPLVLIALALQSALSFYPAKPLFYDNGEFLNRRSQVLAQLQKSPGRQLVVVRYGPNHDGLQEWVYNNADIDGSQIVWARSMGADKDQALLDYYKGRRVWLLEDDGTPRLSPYPNGPEGSGR